MKPRTAASIGVGVSLLIVIITIVFDIFPYAVIGVITALLGLITFVDGLREYLRPPSRPPATNPRNWDAVEGAQLPATTPAAVDHAKQRLAAGCEVHGRHIPRTGALGAASQPLRLDE